MGKKLAQLRKFARMEVSLCDSPYSDDYCWKREVIDNHLDTSHLAENVLEDSRRSRERLEKSLDEARKVIHVWTDYKDRFSTATRNLSIRIEEFDRLQEEKKLKQEILDNKRKKVARSTAISIIRKREKYVPETSVDTFRVR